MRETNRPQGHLAKMQPGRLLGPPRSKAPILPVSQWVGWSIDNSRHAEGARVDNLCALAARIMTDCGLQGLSQKTLSRRTGRARPLRRCLFIDHPERAPAVYVVRDLHTSGPAKLLSSHPGRRHPVSAGIRRQSIEGNQPWGSFSAQTGGIGYSQATVRNAGMTQARERA